MVSNSNNLLGRIRKDDWVRLAWLDNKLFISIYRKNATSTARSLCRIMRDCNLSDDLIKDAIPRIARNIYELNRRELSFFLLISRLLTGISGLFTVMMFTIALLFSNDLGSGLVSWIVILLLEFFCILTVVSIISSFAYKSTMLPVRLNFLPVITVSGGL